MGTVVVPRVMLWVLPSAPTMESVPPRTSPPPSCAMDPTTPAPLAVAPLAPMPLPVIKMPVSVAPPPASLGSQSCCHCRRASLCGGCKGGPELKAGVIDCVNEALGVIFIVGARTDADARCWRDVSSSLAGSTNRLSLWWCPLTRQRTVGKRSIIASAGEVNEHVGMSLWYRTSLQPNRHVGRREDADVQSCRWTSRSTKSRRYRCWCWT